MESKPIHVLLIEDDPADTELIQEILSHIKGLSLHLACSDRLSTGLALFHQKPADVILLDLSLPDSHGLSSLTRIRAETAGTPVVILTSLNDDGIAMKAIQEGAQDYLVKGKVTADLLAHSLSRAIERKAADEALRASELRYRQLFEDANDAILVTDEEGLYIDANRRAEELLGYTREELLRIGLADIIPPEVMEREQLRYEEFKGLGRMSGESIVLRKNGVRVHVEFSANRLAPGRYLSILRDVTQRRQTEEALRKSEERFHLIARATNDAVWDWDLISNTLWWNDRFKTLFGYKTEEIEPGAASWSNRLHPEDKERILSSIHAAIDRGEHSWTEEYRFLRSDGSYATILDRGHVFHNKGGRAVRMIGAMMDITERKRDEEALKDSHQLFRAVIEGITDSVYVKDLQSRYVMINSAVASIFGRPAEEIIGKNDAELFSHATATEIIESDRRIMQSGETQTFDEVATIKGIARTFLSTKGPRRNYQGEIIGLIGISWDITERKQMEESVRAYAQQQKALAELGQLALDGLDLSALLDRVAALIAHALGTNYCRILELLPDGKTLVCRTKVEWNEGLIRTDLPVHSKSQENLRIETPLTASVFPGEQEKMDGISVIIPGASRPFGTLSVHSLSPRRFTEEETGFLQVVANMLATAIERQRAEEIIQHRAYYDALTGLPNRSLLENHLLLALARADRHNDLVALMFLDLDRFKEINDTLGHPVGDQLLKSVSERLSTCIRDGDTFARLGGDEFTILLPEIDSTERVTRVAERILEAFVPPFRVAGHELKISASIGIALYPHSGRDPETLLKNADTALYRAKGEGRNTFCFFSSMQSENRIERSSLASALRQALDRDELLLHFQPQVDIQTGQIVGFELFVRWLRPGVGLVPPAEFIPLAEETGLIVPMEEWILRAASAQSKRWQEAGFPSIRMTINLSARQFHRDNLVETVTRIVKETGFDPKILEIELSESILMGAEENLLPRLRQLAAMGMNISIENFGTGYSSLTYLERFPIGKLKIDPIFVRNITTNPNDAMVTQTIVAMAQSLHLKTIAEGVETEEQVAFLRSIGCDEIQGNLFSPPLSVEEATRLLAEGKHFRPSPS